MGKPPHAQRRSITYCVVPEDLTDKLHELLRRHFADDEAVEVVVEQRWRDRRRSPDRRSEPRPTGDDQRRIRAAEGRRVADRRAQTLAVEPPNDLPRRARAELHRVVFLERLEPSTQELEDRDTARVVARFQAGDEDAFSLLYMRYFDRIYAYLRVMLNDAHEAEDLTQHVFAKIFEALPGYERRAQPFRAWLFRIVRNAGISRIRELKRVEPVDAGELAGALERTARVDDSSTALRWITDRELLMFVERLSLAQRQVVLLRFGLGMNSGEIAEVLDMTPDQVRAIQRRALVFLEQRLSAVGRGAEPGKSVRMRRWRRQAPVLRGRRFALSP